LQSGPKVRLAWRDNATNETGFVIERSTDGVNFTQIATAPARAGTGNTSYIDTTVAAADLTYTYRVKAVNPVGSSAYSNLASILVPSLPLAPSDLTATAFLQGGNARVTLNWVDLATNETGYRIQRSTDPNFTTFGQSTVGANQQTWTSGNLAHNVTYYFRIQAYNSAGVSAWVVVSVLTP
jgi:titin